MSIEIKSVGFSDYDAKIKLDKEIFKYHTKILPDMFKLKNFKAITKQDFELKLQKANYFCLGIYVNTELVGCIEGEEKSSKNGDYLWIDSFVVLPEYRGNGFGMALMSKVDEYAKIKNLRIELSVWVGNDIIKLYKKWGFKEQRIILGKRFD